MTRAAQRTWLARSAAALFAAIILWLVPPFHILPLESARQRGAAGLFDASAYVESFWTERLLPAASQAPDALELVNALGRDPQAAAKTHGRQLGLSSATCYFVSGSGLVQRVTPVEIEISLGNDSRGPRVVIEIGPVFGNTIRDGSGLLEVNDFPNSRDFNAISAELNRRVEERVLPTVAANAVPGATVRFAGCAEILETGGEIGTLRVVPIIVEFP
jgi:predicted lipoprotein